MKKVNKIDMKGTGEVVKRAVRLEQLVVEYVPIDSLKPNAYNPNRQSPKDFELLQKSMKEDGFTTPIVAQKGTRIIVDGEHRWRAARSIGMETVPVVFVDMDEAQMRIATLRHNRARGSEDAELSTQLIRDLRELGALAWAQDSLNISDADLTKLIGDLPIADQLASEEYGDAWVPVAGTPIADGSHTAHGVVSSTDAHRQIQAEFQKKLDAAKTLPERAAVTQAIRDSGSLQIAVSFSGEEAQVVRQVLGAKPAVKLLELCQKRVVKTQEGV